MNTLLTQRSLPPLLTSSPPHTPLNIAAPPALHAHIHTCVVLHLMLLATLQKQAVAGSPCLLNMGRPPILPLLQPPCYCLHALKLSPPSAAAPL